MLLTSKEIAAISDPENRITVRDEQAIAKKLVRAILSRQYTISVNNGEDTVLSDSTDAKAVFAALLTTDEDYLIVRADDGWQIGWFRLIWGNGEDVLSDYSSNPKCDAINRDVIGA